MEAEAMKRGPFLSLSARLRAKRRPDGRKRRASLAPIVEGMERRELLTTVVVNTTIDANAANASTSPVDTNGNNQISLRSAIQYLNNLSGADTVTVPAGTYTLSLGEIDVTGALTISGMGSASTIIEAGTTATNGTSKIFSFNPFNDGTGNPTVPAGFAVSLSGVTLQYAKNPVTFANDSGHSEGGAFDFDAGSTGAGSLSLSDVVVANNQTTAGDGGGIALFDGGTITITNSKFSNNTANGTSLGGGGSGGAIYVGDNYSTPLTMTVTSTTITGNKTAGTAAGSGGGLFSFAGIDGAGDASNSIALHDDTITSNTAAAGQDGGGVDVYGGLTVDQGTVISGNQAGRWGGGLFLSGTANITNTTIVTNSASGGVGATNINQGGGGIFANDSASNVTVTDSRIVGNTATVGGSQLDGDGAASSGGILNAANNWFGTNTPSSSFFGGGVKTLTTTPYLKMTFAASPTTLGTGTSSTLTASITTNSAGTSGFTVPDGTPASFSGGTIGSVNPASTTTSSGSATSTFTAGPTPSNGNVSATIDNQTLTVQLTITAPLTANPQTVPVSHDSLGTTITLTGSDPNNPALMLTYAIATQPTHGTLSNFNANTGGVTYIPAAGYHGTDSFTFTDHDSNGTSAPATVTLNVAVGTPTANGQTVPVAHDIGGTSIMLTGSDDDSPTLTQTFNVATQPAHGTLTGTAPNLTYKPATGYHGTDSFTFTESNGVNTSAPATVTLNVAIGTPTANAQTVNVAHDSGGTAITLTGSDDDTPTLTQTFNVATQPAHGTLTGTAPNLTYKPAAGYHGTDSFTFTVNNGTNTSAPATVTLNVAIGTPSANAQTVSTNQNTALPITLTGSDDDTPALNQTFAFTQPAHGTVTVSGPAGSPTVVYTPNANYTGPDSFTFTDSNGTNTSAAATVSISVNSSTATVSGTVGVSWGTSRTATLQTYADGLRLLPTGRNTDLPWLGINQLSITLSQAETLSPSDVTVTGINLANYGPVTISGSGTHYTITLAQPINAADRVTVTIGNAGIATFTRRLDVLPGDFNDDGGVTMQDAIAIRNEYLGISGASPTLFGDINGDGVVDVNDYNAVRRLIGTTLP